MTCYLCRYQWCWICGGTYTRDHYMPLNPLGCGGQQFAQKRVWYIQIWINLGWILLALVLIPLILVFLVLCGCVMITWNRSCRYFYFKNWYNFMIGLLVGLIAFSIGMALNGIFIPVVVVFGIPYYLFNMWFERRRVHREAEQILEEI